MSRRVALSALEAALVVVAVYALVLVVAGRHAGRIFDTFGFGARATGISSGQPFDHVRLVYGVLGAVLLGWVVLMLTVVRAGLRDTADPRWWWALVLSAGCWFVADTGFSLAVGAWQHALFNLPFAAALGIPLAALRPPRTDLAPSLPG